MGQYWRKLALAGAFILAIAGTFVFGYRAGTHARRIRSASDPIRPWMSVPFIAHTHHVRPEILYQAIGVQPRVHDRRPVRQIAHAAHRPVADVIHDLENAIERSPRSDDDRKAPAGKGP